MTYASEYFAFLASYSHKTFKFAIFLVNFNLFLTQFKFSNPPLIQILKHVTFTYDFRQVKLIF